MLTKVLLVGLILALMGGGLWGISLISQSKSPGISGIPLLGTTASTTNSSLEKRLTDLEVALGQVVDSLKKDQQAVDLPSGDGSVESRVKILETGLADLKNRVKALETGGTTQTSGKKSPVYIPLGWVGSAVSTDWSSIAGATFIFDPADYPGYTSAQFETYIRIYQGNGRAYARVGSSDASSAIITSEVTTTSENYSWVSSPTFSLNSTKQTYYLHLKSLTGYSADVTNARLKINF